MTPAQCLPARAVQVKQGGPTRLKLIYRTLSPATDRCPEDRIYGHATQIAQERFLADHPDAQAIDPIEVTANQLAVWRSLGRWEDDWHSRRFVEAGSLLRWPEDRREPRPLTRAEYAEIFSAAVDADGPDAFIRAWANSYNFGGSPDAAQPEPVIRFLRQLWDAAHWSISTICCQAAVSMVELSRISLVPYRTLQRWASDDDKFSVRDRYYLLTLLGLLPEF